MTMPDPFKPDLLPVTQEDRDAAANVLPDVNEHCGKSEQALILTAQCDDDPLVQAFVRHRTAALQSGAGVREALEAFLSRASSKGKAHYCYSAFQPEVDQALAALAAPDSQVSG